MPVLLAVRKAAAVASSTEGGAGEGTEGFGDAGLVTGGVVASAARSVLGWVAMKAGLEAFMASERSDGRIFHSRAFSTWRRPGRRIWPAKLRRASTRESVT